MDIAIRTPGSHAALSTATLGRDLGFGKYFADLMFRMRYSEATGWRDPEIVPYAPIALDPAAMVFTTPRRSSRGRRPIDGRTAGSRCSDRRPMPPA